MNSKLEILHQMWRLQIINPSQIISYLEYLEFELISLTLEGISIQSKDQTTKFIYGNKI